MYDRNAEKSVVKQYFSDFRKWNICVTVLFVIIYTLELAGVWENDWGSYWLIPICYLLLLSLMFRYYILFFAAVKDMRRNRIEETEILVREIIRDKKYNFFNKGGVMIGKEKCILIDSADNEYRVVADQGYIAEMRAQKDYRDAQVVIRYLSVSRIVLSMKLKPSKSSNGATQHLRRDFSHYFP